MTLHFTFDPFSSPSLPSALASDAGLYRVEIGCSPQALHKRLGAIRSWLLDWQMPHRVDIERHSCGLQILVTFPEAAHAHACQIEFGGRLEAVGARAFPSASAPEPCTDTLVAFSGEAARRQPRGGRLAYHGDRGDGADRIGGRRAASQRRS